ncbi:MAG: hypothetical protein DHS20C16_33420 [Phycisphaerae bacterium]|nr:MAG: hypothetical protein DHS20C16_33420 [Phycisphaerae bacterium]
MPINRLQQFVLRVSRRVPALNKKLCSLWNINTKAYWDGEYSAATADQKWSEDKRLYFYKLAETALPNGNATILDAGSALGAGGRYLMDQNSNWKIEGLDFSAAACERAVIKTHCVDLLKENVQGQYDYVLAIQTLEHFPSPNPIIAKLFAAAREALILTVPYAGQLSPTHPVSFDENSFADYEHVNVKLSERIIPKTGQKKTDMLAVLSKRPFEFSESSGKA